MKLPRPTHPYIRTRSGWLYLTVVLAERRLHIGALEHNRWKVSQAARALGISRDTMRYRIDKFGLKP